MKKIAALMSALVLALALSACTTVSPVCATSNPVGAKVGEASASVILGIIPIPLNQDTGIQKAAANGNISKISTVDYKMTTIAGIFTTYSTIVTGE